MKNLILKLNRQKKILSFWRKTDKNWSPFSKNFMKNLGFLFIVIVFINLLCFTFANLGVKPVESDFYLFFIKMDVIFFFSFLIFVYFYTIIKNFKQAIIKNSNLACEIERLIFKEHKDKLLAVIPKTTPHQNSKLKKRSL